MNDADGFVVNISCADAIDLVTDYLDREMSAADLERFERHLATCEGCTVLVDQMKMTITLTSVISGRHVEVLPRNFDDLAQLLVGTGRTGVDPSDEPAQRIVRSFD